MGAAGLKNRRRRSSRRLPFFHEQLDDIDIQPQRLRQGNLVGSRRTHCWLTNSENSSVANRHDLSDGSVPIQNRNYFAATYSSQVFAQSYLQFCNPHSLHSHILTISSHSKSSVLQHPEWMREGSKGQAKRSPWDRATKKTRTEGTPDRQQDAGFAHEHPGVSFILDPSASSS